jgi:16S rRNA processing protein RimM
MTSTETPSDHDRLAGSSSRGEPAFLAVGRLRKPHGLKGELQMEVITDFPERLKRGVTVHVGSDYIPKTIKSVRTQNQLLLVAFEGCESPEAASDLRSQLVFVPSAGVPSLEEGEYYHHQLLGLIVMDEDQRLLGTITDILETGANDVYVVTRDSGPDILFPGTDEVILDIDLVAGVMKIHLLPGLLDE